MLAINLNDRYRLTAELGQGGMGIVYRAYDTLLEREVAVKILSASNLGTEGRSRLIQEARATAQLNHPNIVTIFDAGEEHDLAVGCGLGCFVPAHMHAPTHRVDGHCVLAGLRQRGLLRFVGFTHRVSVPNSLKPAPALKKSDSARVQLRFLG